MALASSTDIYSYNKSLVFSNNGGLGTYQVSTGVGGKGGAGRALSFWQLKQPAGGCRLRRLWAGAMRHRSSGHQAHL